MREKRERKKREQRASVSMRELFGSTSSSLKPPKFPLFSSGSSVKGRLHSPGEFIVNIIKVR